MMGLPNEQKWNSNSISTLATEKIDSKINNNEQLLTSMLESEIIPTIVDWRKAGVVTNVNDQGQCGACWAFSAVEEIESIFLMENPVWQQEVQQGWGLSVQQVMDCENFGIFGGCNGGWADLGYEYVKKSGIMNATSDPYTGSQGVCLPLNPPVTFVSNYSFGTPPCLLDCVHQNMTELMQSVAEIAPMSVCLDADGFDGYTGGIMPASACQSAFTSMNHCVQIVGYSINSTNPSQSYWLIRNSWGTNWGVENGFVYLQLDSTTNTCGLANQATYVQLKSSSENENFFQPEVQME